MLHEWVLGGEFFALLSDWDREIARCVAAAGCGHCGGPLYQANYQRKPRGAALAAGGEEFSLRHSLCCGREGCRKRALPPSLRFLGRRVYLEVVVVLASVWALVAGEVEEAVAATKVPRWTLARWGLWWRGDFARSSAWSELRARFAPPPPAQAELPASLVDRLRREAAAGPGAVEIVERTMLMVGRSLASATTGSVAADRIARFLRDAAERMQGVLLAQKM